MNNYIDLHIGKNIYHEKNHFSTSRAKKLNINKNDLGRKAEMYFTKSLSVFCKFFSRGTEVSRRGAEVFFFQKGWKGPKWLGRSCRAEVSGAEVSKPDPI